MRWKSTGNAAYIPVKRKFMIATNSNDLIALQCVMKKLASGGNPFNPPLRDFRLRCTTSPHSSILSHPLLVNYKNMKAFAVSEGA